MLNGGPTICWKSLLQTAVAASTSEAEYMALFTAVSEAIHLRQVLQDLGFTQHRPTPILEDNQSCRALTKHSQATQRFKHVDEKYRFSRQKVKGKHVLVKFCSTLSQLAEGFTIPLPSKRRHEIIQQNGS